MSNPQNTEHDVFEPFPEPRTIPAGWNLSEAPAKEVTPPDDHLQLPLPEQPTTFCLN